MWVVRPLQPLLRLARRLQMASPNVGLRPFYDHFLYGIIRSAICFVTSHTYTVPATTLHFVCFSMLYWGIPIPSWLSFGERVCGRAGFYFFCAALPDFTAWLLSFFLETVVLKGLIRFLERRRLEMPWSTLLFIQCGLVILSYCWYLFQTVPAS